MKRIYVDVGQCCVCNTGKAVWKDPDNQISICDSCYSNAGGRGTVMARDVTVYSTEIDEAIKSVQTMNRKIIPRYVTEEEIWENRHKYLRVGEHPEISLQMVISELASWRPDTKIYGKCPVSCAFDCISSSQGAKA
ncbi:MAG: hypothetical protein GXY18_12315 [Methanomicrobiales archaeon]|nr:hypothetical protein [Methanomicrobiales archaeon]